MDTKKIILFIIFSSSLLILWDAWMKGQEHFNAPAVTQTDQGAQSVPDDTLPVPGSTLKGTLAKPSDAVIDDVPAQSSVEQHPLVIGKRIRVVTDMVIAEIDTVGGDLRRLELLQQPSAEDKDIPYTLLQDRGERIHVAQSGLVGEGLPNHKTIYQPESGKLNYELAAGEDEISVRLFAPEANGLNVVKVYTFHRDSYVIDTRFEIQNDSTTTAQPFVYSKMLRNNVEPPSKTRLLPTYLGAAFYTDEEKYQKYSLSDFEKGDPGVEKNANDGWVAMLEHYFVTAWLPPQDTAREFFIKQQNDGLFSAGLITPVDSIAPGETKSITLPLYAGPTEQHRLENLAPGLELTVDYRWLAIIAKPLFQLLSFYHSLADNWGIAIILLTVTIKLLFFPLSAAGYRSMAKMRVVTPKLKRIQEQYKGDRQRLNQAMMELYKQEKINPMGGCLPILVQVPVFIALYWTILAAVELRYAPFALWITDLSAPDPLYILPAVMGISMFVQTKLNPTPTDKLQARIMQIMPVAFCIIFFFFPVGLVLYSLVNNILSILQQWKITKMYGAPTAAKSTTDAEIADATTDSTSTNVTDANDATVTTPPSSDTDTTADNVTKTDASVDVSKEQTIRKKRRKKRKRS